MSGFVIAMAPCLQCGRPFSFNPLKVPSYRVNGVREPICEECMNDLNVQRKALGLDPFPIAPDAYAAIPETEL
jgi:hypothetical protein